MESKHNVLSENDLNFAKKTLSLKIKTFLENITKCNNIKSYSSKTDCVSNEIKAFLISITENQKAILNENFKKIISHLESLKNNKKIYFKNIHLIDENNKILINLKSEKKKLCIKNKKAGVCRKKKSNKINYFKNKIISIKKKNNLISKKIIQNIADIRKIEDFLSK